MPSFLNSLSFARFPLPLASLFFAASLAAHAWLTRAPHAARTGALMGAACTGTLTLAVLLWGEPRSLEYELEFA